MSDLLPVFIDPVVLQQQGFHDSGLTKPTRPLPSLTPLARAQLIQKYDSDITVHRLIATQINADGSTLRVRELGTGGRLLFQQGKFSITNNEVNSESWFAYGPVELYLSDSFTDSVFAQSESMKEACRE